MERLRDLIVEYNNQNDDNNKKIIRSRIILALVKSVREKDLLPILVDAVLNDGSTGYSYNVNCLTHHGTPQALVDFNCHNDITHYKKYSVLGFEIGRLLREIEYAGDCGILQIFADDNNAFSLWEDDLERILYPEKRISVLQADITDLPVDAVVNSANDNYTDSTSGVNHEILKAAGSIVGEELLNAARESMNGCVTSAGNLPSRAIIHIKAPNAATFQDDPDTLYGTYQSIFEYAKDNDFHVLAIPSLGTGKKGIPKEAVANVAVNVAQKWLDSNPEYDLFVFFVTYSQDSYKTYMDVLRS